MSALFAFIVVLLAAALVVAFGILGRDRKRIIAEIHRLGGQPEGLQRAPDVSPGGRHAFHVRYWDAEGQLVSTRAEVAPEAIYFHPPKPVAADDAPAPAFAGQGAPPPPRLTQEQLLRQEVARLRSQLAQREAELAQLQRSRR